MSGCSPPDDAENSLRDIKPYVMASSAGSNRTNVFEESVGGVPKHFYPLRHSHKLKENRPTEKGTVAYLSGSSSSTSSKSCATDGQRHGVQRGTVYSEGDPSKNSATINQKLLRRSAASLPNSSSETEYSPPPDEDSNDDGSPFSSIPAPPAGSPPAVALPARCSGEVEGGGVDHRNDSSGSSTKAKGDKRGKVASMNLKPNQVTTPSTTFTSSSERTSTRSSPDEAKVAQMSSMGPGSSRLSRQSEAPSSRLPVGPTLLHPVTPSPMFYGVSHDQRSSLVSSVDVDVAVLQRDRRCREAEAYLALRMPSRAMRSRTSSNSAPTTVDHLTAPEAGPGTSSSFSLDRNKAMTQRHMDAVVEAYLSAPKFRSALQQFEKHLPVLEQRLRTAAASHPSCDATRVSMLCPNEAPKVRCRDTTGGYQLQPHDIELLAVDWARRARFMDDTLPWRPIDFTEADIRLEPLDWDVVDRASDTILGTTPSVGGSVKLLVEVLIFTEIDLPSTSAIPSVDYTNMFLLLGPLFVQMEVLLVKFIRLFRSIRAWETTTPEPSRSVYLEQRLLRCVLAYCRIHEADLTLSCLRRLACFIEEEGVPGAAPPLDDVVGHRHWECREGVNLEVRRPATVRLADGLGFEAGSANAVHHGRRTDDRDACRPPGRKIPGYLTKSGMQTHLNRATAPLPPLHAEVSEMVVELHLFVQQAARRYYIPAQLSASSVEELRYPSEGPPQLWVPSGLLRPPLGSTYGISKGSGATAAAGGAVPYPAYTDGGLYGSPTFLRGGGGSSNGLPHLTAPNSPLFPSSPSSRLATASPAIAADEYPRARTSVLDMDAKHLAHQLCLLSFRLFAAVHIRELLNNAWADPTMKSSVARNLNEMMDFSAHLQRWIAAVIVTPTTWELCQQSLQYFLELCRVLYEQQNYEMASAVLEGLRHPAVLLLEQQYGTLHSQSLLSSGENRERETLQELMDPFAPYSPSSLYSVAARTVGDMGAPMIPLLSPILEVVFRAQEVKGPTVSIRTQDGRTVVNWSKLMGLGKTVVLWMRCQQMPYSFCIDERLQEYLWSIKYHQWTDAVLIRAAGNPKQ